jgi:metal-responsive CopG/Arc/MetJ family transcriptional regulator
MAELERPERLQIMLTADELAALENWRYDKRMPSRSAAVRELLRRGLASDGFLTAEQGIKSQDFGVLPDGEDPKPAG